MWAIPDVKYKDSLLGAPMKSKLFQFLLIFLFSTSLYANPIILDDPNWCSGSEILKRNLLLGIQLEDTLSASITVTSEPSSGALLRPSILNETYEVIGTPVEDPSTVLTKITIPGELGDRVMDHKGFFNEWFRGLFEETPLGGFTGTILSDVTVPVKDENGDIVEQTLKAACLFVSITPYLTEEKNPVAEEDRGYLRHFEWLSIVVSPEVPFGVVSFTYKSWKSDTINKPQTKNQTEFKIQYVSRLIPVEIK